MYQLNTEEGTDEDCVQEGKIATAEAAAKADEDPPLDQLMRLMKEQKEVVRGESVVYWMRMEDVRSDPFFYRVVYRSNSKCSRG